MDYLKLLGSEFYHFRTLFWFIFPLELSFGRDFFPLKIYLFPSPLTFLVVHSCFVIHPGLLLFHAPPPITAEMITLLIKFSSSKLSEAVLYPRESLARAEGSSNTK